MLSMFSKVCRAHEVMQQTAQQQCRQIYDVLGSAGYAPADAQRCGVYAINALLVVRLRHELYTYSDQKYI
jgi:hypothetical protein